MLIKAPRAACLLAGVLAIGCSGGGSGGSRGGASIAPATSRSTPAPTTSSTTTPAPLAATLVAPEILPVIVIHGHGGTPRGFKPFLERYARGFASIDELCAKEADQLKAGDLPFASVIVAEYYKESKPDALYDLVNGVGTGSIGGCPAPRTDGHAAEYPVSYAERLARIVEGVRRATGSDRVDLVCHSMGNLVGRAYTKWLSDGAQGGKSKVRRILCLAGPQRGINALEAFVDGFDHGAPREFMRFGENAEMCSEYKGWQGNSYIDQLNYNWDAFCAAKDVHYGGVTAYGAKGDQVAPPPPPPPPGTPPPAPPPPGPLGIKLSGTFADVWNALQAVNYQTLPQAAPYFMIFLPHLMTELTDALGHSDGTVRVDSARMDKAPFLGAEFYVVFEGRHSSEWNPEQAVHASEFTAELARRYFLGTKMTDGTASSVVLRLVDSPGKASFLALDTSIANGSAVAAQVVEERLDAQGKPTGGATGYCVPVPAGEQHAFFQVATGGGARRYHVVVYGANGILAQKDETFTLTDGVLDTTPATAYASATNAQTANGPKVAATFTSNSADPTLRFSYRLDGGDWSAWSASGTFTTPPLGAGEHRLDARARHAANAAGVAVEDAKGASIGIFVDQGGAVTIRK